MQFYPLKIKDIRQETADCISIQFDIPDSIKPSFQFTQGQFLTLKTHIDGEEVRRSYSICTSPFDDEWRVAIKKVHEGVFSNFAHKTLQKGDIIEVAPPDGRFFPQRILSENKPTKKYVLIAAGSGITPILSILKTVLKQEPKSEVTLIYGNRNTSAVIFKEEIEGLKNRYMERLRVFHILSRERMDSALFHGRINAHKFSEICAKIPDILRGSDEIEYFLCGPEDMINDVKTELLNKGIDKNYIHFELFGTKKALKTADNIILKDTVIATADIILDGVKFEIPIHDGENILDAALNMGADLPFACKGGVCCTCRAKLTEGVVEMETNYSLEQDELDAGFILTCQSKPKTSRVVIDFDKK